MPQKIYPMDTENKVSPEELATDQAALQVAKEEEVRIKVIEDFGFDETADAEKITKAVAREIEHSKRLSSAIGQKIKYRDAVQKNKPSEKKPTEAAPETKKEDDLSTIDLYALVENKISQEDIPEVTRAAKLLGKTVSEAIKDPIVKGILTKKAEDRATAEAAHTGTARRTTQKVSPEELVQGLKDGKVPDKGTEDAEELFWARRGGRRK